MELTNAITPVLLIGGSGDGIAIVTAEEDEWALQCGWEVETSMGITFTGGSLSKVAYDRPVSILPLQRIGSPSG